MIWLLDAPAAKDSFNIILNLSFDGTSISIGQFLELAWCFKDAYPTCWDLCSEPIVYAFFWLDWKNTGGLMLGKRQRSQTAFICVMLVEKNSQKKEYIIS